MARVIISNNFHDQRKLLADVSAKHTADGATSVLTIFLTENNIVLADDLLASTTALGLHEQFEEAQKMSEDFREKRDKSFAPAMKVLRGSAQFLKSLYKTNVQKLGEYGFTVNNEKRIAYPVEFIEQYNLFTAFKAKHDSFPAGTSPLEAFFTQQQIVIDDIETLADEAKDHHDAFTLNAGNAENHREQRDLVWDTSLANLYDIGDYLKKLYSNNPKNLANWGYRVDDSPQAPVERTSKVLALSQKTIKSVVIGGNFKNVGAAAVNLHRGDNTSEPAVLVNPNQIIVVQKGFSTVTIVNPSTTETATVKLMVNA